MYVRVRIMMLRDHTLFYKYIHGYVLVCIRRPSLRNLVPQAGRLEGPRCRRLANVTPTLTRTSLTLFLLPFVPASKVPPDVKSYL